MVICGDERYSEVIDGIGSFALVSNMKARFKADVSLGKNVVFEEISGSPVTGFSSRLSAEGGG